MKVQPSDARLQSLIKNATAMALEPWNWSRTDLLRSQRILRAGGFNNMADELQSFIDEPALPLGWRLK